MNVTFPTLMGLFHTTLNNVQWITTAYLPVDYDRLLTSGHLDDCPGRLLATQLLLPDHFNRFGPGVLFRRGHLRCGPQLVNDPAWAGDPGGGNRDGAAPLIMTQVPRQQQGTYVGTAGMIIALAPSLGPTYGGTVLDLLDWRYNFIFTLPLIAIFGWVAIKNAIKNRRIVE